MHFFPFDSFLIFAVNILKAKNNISTPLRIENPGIDQFKTIVLKVDHIVRLMRIQSFKKDEPKLLIHNVNEDYIFRKRIFKVKTPEKSPIVPPITEI